MAKKRCKCVKTKSVKMRLCKKGKKWRFTGKCK